MDTGLFYFDASYRPVPLEMQFVGVSERNILAAKNIMDEVAYQKVKGGDCWYSSARSSIGLCLKTLLVLMQLRIWR